MNCRSLCTVIEQSRLDVRRCLFVQRTVTERNKLLIILSAQTLAVSMFTNSSLCRLCWTLDKLDAWGGGGGFCHQ